MLLQKEVTPGPYRIGDTASYTVTVSNPDAESTVTVTLTDTLPEATEYISATSRLVITGSQGERVSTDEPRQQQAGQLSWTDLVLEPGAVATATYDLRILQGAVSPLVNNVQAVGTGVAGSVVANAVANATISIEDELFASPIGTITGRVYLDSNRDGRFTEGVDGPLENARVILGNGWQTRTDALGNYAFRDVVSDTLGEVWTVQLDSETAPYTPRPHVDAFGDGYTHRIRASGLSVTDFVLEPPLGLTDVDREITIMYGPVRITKQLISSPSGSEVIMTISSSVPFPNLVIRDPQPDGSVQEFNIDLVGEEVIRYSLPAGSALTDPSVGRGQ